MFLVPWLAGALTARAMPAVAILVAAAALLGFIARQPLVAWLRASMRGRPDRRAAAFAVAYAGGAVLCGAVAIVGGQVWSLLPVAGAALVLGGWHLAQAMLRQERSLAGEMVAVASGALAAPAAHLAAGGAETAAIWLWALCVLYFGSSVFYLKLRVGTAHPRAGNDPAVLWWRCAAYHGLLVLALAAMVAAGHTGLAVALGFAAVVVRAAWFLARPSATLNLRRLGLLEVAYSAAFLALVVVGLPGPH
jgi:hypothetical protein